MSPHSEQVDPGAARESAERRLTTPIERAPFLDTFPSDPALEPLVGAFVRGDYATVRRLAPTVAAQATDEAVRDAALELSARIRPDPLARYLLAITLVLLLFLVFWAYGGHAH